MAWMPKSAYVQEVRYSAMAWTPKSALPEELCTAYLPKLEANTLSRDSSHPAHDIQPSS